MSRDVIACFDEQFERLNAPLQKRSFQSQTIMQKLLICISRAIIVIMRIYTFNIVSFWSYMKRSLRTAWDNYARDVRFGVYYRNGVHGPVPGLSDFEGYEIAKKGIDDDGREYSLTEQMEAAQAIIERVLEANKEFKRALLDALLEHPEALIVAPSVASNDRKNVLPIAFAHALADLTGNQVCENIYQAPKSKSRRQMDGRERIACETQFYGNVTPQSQYFMVDDVLTMGGTLASLRGFVESNGGKVVGIAVLADGSRAPGCALQGCGVVKLASNPEQHAFIRAQYKSPRSLDQVFKEVTGHDIEKLTHREAEFITRYRGDLKGLRAGLTGRAYT